VWNVLTFTDFCVVLQIVFGGNVAVVYK